MPGDGLSPDDVPPAQRSRADEVFEELRALLGAHERRTAPSPAGLAAFNAELDAAAAVERAMHTAALQAFRERFVGPPLPRGFRARQERERRRRADMRALLKKLRDT